MEYVKFWILVFCTFAPILHTSAESDEDDDYLTFPPGFRLGAGGAAYQIEGAWNISDKGVSVWDAFTHLHPRNIKDGSNGDVACDSYHKYKEDVRWVKEIGFKHYRFSLSWTRILPTGYPNIVSKDGIRYYRDLINELHRNGIEPIVTLYHWDLPQVLEDQGGWTNSEVIQWFADYARIVFRELGPMVKTFTTINEPTSFCREGYGHLDRAPNKDLDPLGTYLCGHNALKAHARAYHIYDREFRPTQNGTIGIVFACPGQIAKNPGDEVAVDTYYQFTCGWFAHPIYSEEGDYPEVMKTRIAQNSFDEGYFRSRLPTFSPKWIEYIRGTADYFGLNHYTSLLVEEAPKERETILDTGIQASVDPSWPDTATSWLKIVPPGFGGILRKIRDEYNNPTVFVLENGSSDNRTTLSDTQRIGYFYAYLKEMITAIKRDGCNITMYTVWSLLDNFEWNNGYTQGFGIVQVDFKDPNRSRTPKLSVDRWKEVVRTGNIQPMDPMIEDAPEPFGDRESKRSAECEPIVVKRI